MKIFALLFCLFLAGCGSDEGRNNYGYGWHYDMIGGAGLRVRYHPGQNGPIFSDIEQIYKDVMSCADIRFSGPLVIFVESLGGDRRGKIYFDTGSIIIATSINDRPQEMIYSLKHEFVHYLLHQSGFSIDANRSHQSNLFLDCTSTR